MMIGIHIEGRWMVLVLRVMHHQTDHEEAGAGKPRGIPVA